MINELIKENMRVLKVCVCSPYVDIQTQIDRDCEIVEMLADNEDIKNYDLSLMIPKVTYDDWIVCLYKKDDKFYYINEEEVMEVVPVEILEYNSQFRAKLPNGKTTSSIEKLLAYRACFCCGEADDMTCYVYFDAAE